MAKLNPYLAFQDSCEEAFNFYKSVFGGEFTMISRFKDAPKDSGMSGAPGEEERILHVSLPIGDNVLMGSDTPNAMGEVVFGNSNNISVSVDSKEEADRVFKGLSEGGQVVMPIEEAFWNSYFGMCIDKFNVYWMVSFDHPPKE